MNHLCILFAVAFVPIAMRMSVVHVGDSTFIDVFTWIKAASVVVIGSVAAYRKLPPWPIVLWVALSCVFAKYPDLAWFGFPDQYFGGAHMLALFAIATAATNVRVVFVEGWIAVGSLAVSFVGLAQYCGWNPYGFAMNGDIASTLFNSNYVGLYGACVLPVLIAAELMIPAGVLVVTVLVSGSLSGLIAACVGIAVWVAVENKPLRVPIVLLVALAFFCFYEPGLHGRTVIWENTLPMITAFGSGLSHFPVEYPNYAAQYVDKPHNVYLQVAHAFGWVGLATFVAFIAFLLRRGRMIGGLVGFLVAGFFNDLYIGVAPIVFVLIGVALGDNDD